MIQKLLDLIFIKGALMAFFKTKIFSLSSYKMMKRMKKIGVSPKTIIDIGANKGQFSNLADYILNPNKIIAIEANPNLEEDLNKNLLHIKNKTILISGIGNYEGELPFNFNLDSQVSSFLEVGPDRLEAFPDDKNIEIRNIPIAKLDSLIQISNIDEPILLKIDVQGFEKEVIEGAINVLKSVRWILIETSFLNLYNGEPNFVEMLDILKSLGFHFKGPMNFHESPDKFNIIEMDALFVKNESI
jgi:FkbM family methyltransferase